MKLDKAQPWNQLDYKYSVEDQSNYNIQEENVIENTS